MAIMFLESIKPVSYIGSQMSIAFLAPFLVFENTGIDYIKFFEKRGNVEKLLKRIEEEIKVRDGEKRKAKEQERLVSDKFGFRLELLSGFSLQEDATYDRLGSGVVGIAGRNPAKGGFVAISFQAADSSPYDTLNEVSKNLEKEDVRRALMLSQDVVLSRLHKRQDLGKIKGHKASMTSYEWSDGQGQRGILEGYGMWCDKTRRLFVLSMRTGPLTGGKSEKDQVRDLRLILGSLRCHQSLVHHGTLKSVRKLSGRITASRSMVRST